MYTVATFFNLHSFRKNRIAWIYTVCMYVYTYIYIYVCVVFKWNLIGYYIIYWVYKNNLWSEKMIYMWLKHYQKYCISKQQRRLYQNQQYTIQSCKQSTIAGSLLRNTAAIFSKWHCKYFACEMPNVVILLDRWSELICYLWNFSPLLIYKIQVIRWV